MKLAKHSPLRFVLVSVVAGTALVLATPALADEIRVSLSPDRSASIRLDGAFITASEAYIFFANTTPASQITEVEFLINGKRWNRDDTAPYDLVGGDAAAALPLDPTRLPTLKDPTAPYDLEVVMPLIDGTAPRFGARFRLATPTNGSGVVVTRATTDVPGRRLILEGFGFFINVPKITPIVMLDLLPLQIGSFDDRMLVAVLPPVPLVGDHLVNVSIDGKSVQGQTDSSHAELLITFGATELSCLGCVSASEVSFSYAGSDSPGGKAFEAEQADFALSADYAALAATAGAAGNTDLLDGLDSTAFSRVEDAQALDSRVTANEGAITALESGVGGGGWGAVESTAGGPAPLVFGQSARPGVSVGG